MTTESYKEDGRPAQQWYWDDWFSAFDVRLCSLAARGLWIEMIGIMFKAEIRGTLTVNGKQINSKTLAKIVGDTMANVNKYLKELEEHDVFSRLEDNTIYCRRLFRESGRQDQISQIRSEAGKKGAEARWQDKGQKIANMAAPSSSTSSTSSSTSLKDKVEEEFELHLWKTWPSEGRFKKKICLAKFRALCKAGKQKEFMKTTRGYATYIQMKWERDNFKQQVMHLATWLNNWEGEKEQYMNLKYEPPL